MPFLAAVGYARSGMAGILAALLAGTVTCTGAMASLWVVGSVRQGPQVVPRFLLGMVLRTGVPLTACIVVLVIGGPLVTAGAPFMILGYYLLMLVAETWLLLKITEPDVRKSETRTQTERKAGTPQSPEDDNSTGKTS